MLNEKCILFLDVQHPVLLLNNARFSFGEIPFYGLLEVQVSQKAGPTFPPFVTHSMIEHVTKLCKSDLASQDYREWIWPVTATGERQGINSDAHWSSHSTVASGWVCSIVRATRSSRLLLLLRVQFSSPLFHFVSTPYPPNKFLSWASFLELFTIAYTTGS